MNYDHVIIVLVCLVIANIFTIAWTITKQRKFTTEEYRKAFKDGATSMINVMNIVAGNMFKKDGLDDSQENHTP